MYPFFIFNNISSRDKGIFVNRLPPIAKPEKNYEEIEIPGRNGKLYIDNGNFNNFTYEITCTLMPGTNIRSISNWLNGEGKLILSTELDKYYNVIVKNQIDFEQIYKVCNEFVVVFDVYPISYGTIEKEININEMSTITITESTYKIKPYIKIEGSGNITLTINNKSVILNDIQEYIELDCELEEAFKDNINCNNKIYCLDFPELQVGKNVIEFLGNITNIYIKYREAYI